MDQPYEERYPTLASSESFEVWEDTEDGSVIVSFNVNGVTVAVDRMQFLEFALVIREASERLHRGDGFGA